MGGYILMSHYPDMRMASILSKFLRDTSNWIVNFSGLEQHYRRSYRVIKQFNFFNYFFYYRANDIFILLYMDRFQYTFTFPVHFFVSDISISKERLLCYNT